MPEVSKEFTPGEYAALYARKRRRPHEMLFTTGRILVKKTFEDLTLPSESRYAELSQYLGSELHELGTILFKTAVIISTDEERTMWGRTLAINKAAQDSSLDIVVYDRNGRVEA
jgi:hypothetical protein